MKIRRLCAAVLAAAVLALVSAPPAAGQGASPPASRNLICNFRPVIVAFLEDTYGESSSAAGLASTGLVLETFVAGDGATWSIVTTGPNGVSCIALRGERWQRAPSPKRGG